MQIESTKLLEVGSLNAKYDLGGKLCKGYTSANWGDDGEIKEAIAADNNKDDDDDNPQEKNK